MDKLLYSISESCKLLSVSRSFLYRMISTGRICKPVKLGKKAVFSQKQLEDFVKGEVERIDKD